jgi:hypothetical protein
MITNCCCSIPTEKVDYWGWEGQTPERVGYLIDTHEKANNDDGTREHAVNGSDFAEVEIR